MIAPDTNTIYHSLQAATSTGSRVAEFDGGLHWSQTIDDAAETINAGGCVCQNPRNRGKAERAASSGSAPPARAGYVWEMPFAKSWKGARL